VHPRRDLSARWDGAFGLDRTWRLVRALGCPGRVAGCRHLVAGWWSGALRRLVLVAGWWSGALRRWVLVAGWWSRIAGRGGWLLGHALKVNLNRFVPSVAWV